VTLCNTIHKSYIIQCTWKKECQFFSQLHYTTYHYFILNMIIFYCKFFNTADLLSAAVKTQIRSTKCITIQFRLSFAMWCCWWWWRSLWMLIIMMMHFKWGRRDVNSCAIENVSFHFFEALHFIRTVMHAGSICMVSWLVSISILYRVFSSYLSRQVSSKNTVKI